MYDFALVTNSPNSPPIIIIIIIIGAIVFILVLRHVIIIVLIVFHILNMTLQLCYTVPSPINILLQRQPPAPTASFFQKVWPSKA